MNEDNIMEISVSNFRNVNEKYTEYEIICITNIKHFKKCYIKAYRRYSDFHKFHKKIKTFISVLPEFPKKKWNKMKSNVIQERMEMLNIYLKYVCEYINKNKEVSDKYFHEVINFIQNE